MVIHLIFISGVLLQDSANMANDSENSDFEWEYESYLHPYIPKFSGDESQDESSFDTFKFHVELYMNGSEFSPEVVKFAVLKALKGAAHDTARRLGTEATLEQILKSLECAYGSVESRENVMKRFYSLRQDTDENIVNYSNRAEIIFTKAVQLECLKSSDTEVLKGVVFSGLRRE